MGMHRAVLYRAQASATKIAPSVVLLVCLRCTPWVVCVVLGAILGWSYVRAGWHGLPVSGRVHCTKPAELPLWALWESCQGLPRGGGTLSAVLPLLLPVAGLTLLPVAGLALLRVVWHAVAGWEPANLAIERSLPPTVGLALPGHLDDVAGLEIELSGFRVWKVVGRLHVRFLALLCEAALPLVAVLLLLSIAALALIAILLLLLSIVRVLLLLPITLLPIVHSCPRARSAARRQGRNRRERRRRREAQGHHGGDGELHAVDLATLGVDGVVETAITGWW
mmetsp:Transcript_1335/g.2786  ORF Transcript_1335/g.2786 Transcript_1335/m.2786 type:complete len:280 (+) Transcript_1335:180-1019(+)